MQNEDSLHTLPGATFDNFCGGHITLKGLLYAIGCIQALPADQQERSDMIEMCALVRGMESPTLAHVLWGVESHIGREIDLWPAHGGDEANGLYTDAELDAKATIRAQIKEWDDQFQRNQAAKDAPPSSAVTFLTGTDDQEPEAA